MMILTIKGVWSKESHKSRRIKWLSSLAELEKRNMRLITELKSSRLSAYHIETWVIGEKRLRLKESAISIRVLV